MRFLVTSQPNMTLIKSGLLSKSSLARLESAVSYENLKSPPPQLCFFKLEKFQLGQNHIHMSKRKKSKSILEANTSYFVWHFLIWQNIIFVKSNNRKLLTAHSFQTLHVIFWEQQRQEYKWMLNNYTSAVIGILPSDPGELINSTDQQLDLANQLENRVATAAEVVQVIITPCVRIQQC